jgi:uncharacterized protein (TIGR04141 family)
LRAILDYRIIPRKWRAKNSPDLCIKTRYVKRNVDQSRASLFGHGTRMMGAKKTTLSIYMLKDGTVATVREKLFADSISLTGELEGQFVVIYGRPRPPAWFEEISSYLQNAPAQPVLSQSSAGLMLISRAAKDFVVCFGHAWQRLEYAWLEADFGRRVALNAIPPKKILELSSEQVFAKWHLARERSPRATEFKEFGVEFDRDLVYAIEGVPKEELLGSVMRGGPSLRMSIPLTSLGRALDRCAALYASSSYRKHWPEIDNLRLIKDHSRVVQLDALLNADLIAGNGNTRVALFSPSLRHGDGAPPESYVFGRHVDSAPQAPLLLFGSFEAQLARRGKSLSLENAKSTPVHMLDEDDQPIETKSVYDCMCYETTSGGRQYILSSGKWYEAAAIFLKSIDAQIRGIKRPSVSLPKWNGSDDEDVYNEGCCVKGSGLHNFDKKLVWFGGSQSKFEFCDLMHPGKRILFFAKIATRSSDMSHLVEQVRRTVELTFGPDGSFRSHLKKKMEQHFPGLPRTWLDQRPNPTEWELCLVSLGRAANDLPLFAKCGVARLVRSLNAYKISFLDV